MRRAERLFRLVALMRAKGLTRAEDLAEDLEVSVRTIYRDIAHLQGSGLPIEGEAGVGYLLRPGFDLPAMTFTYEQMDALALGLKFIEEAGDRRLVEAAREVRSKIDSVLPEDGRQSLQQAPLFAARRGLRAPAFARDIRQAIRRKKIIRIRYQDADGKQSGRRVQPLSLTVFTKGWMVAGWCELRQGFRYFRLDRIVEFSCLDEHFEDHPERSLTAFRQQQEHRTSPYPG